MLIGKIEKFVSEDNFFHGEIGKPSFFGEIYQIKASCFESLIKKFSDFCCVDFRDVDFFNGAFEVCKLENAEGEEPTERENAKFEAGKINLFIANYTCYIYEEKEADKKEAKEVLEIMKGW